MQPPQLRRAAVAALALCVASSAQAAAFDPFPASEETAHIQLDAAAPGASAFAAGASAFDAAQLVADAAPWFEDGHAFHESPPGTTPSDLLWADPTFAMRTTQGTAPRVAFEYKWLLMDTWLVLAVPCLTPVIVRRRNRRRARSWTDQLEAEVASRCAEDSAIDAIARCEAAAFGVEPSPM